MNRILTLVILLFSSIYTVAQQVPLQGTVTDIEGAAIPFATIVKNSSSVGTSANKEGDFKLSLPEGSYQITVSAVGYQPKTLMVTLPQRDSLTIQLANEVYSLQEVVIGNQEDPAYEIIRKAIRKRPYYLSQSGPYTAQTYIKGLQRLTKAPKKFLGVNIEEAGKEMGLDSNRRGIIYLSESESKITVNPPNEFKEEMISSKVSGDNRAFSFNRASDLQLNFYENHQQIIEGLSSRPFVSPIADNAFSYYRYQYKGSSKENGVIVSKIEVIPKRKAEPLYQGDLYIVEDEWRIHSVNFLLDKRSGINFVDSLYIKQLFIPLNPEVWFPATTQLDFKAGLLGLQVISLLFIKIMYLPKKLRKMILRKC